MDFFESIDVDASEAQYLLEAGHMYLRTVVSVKENGTRRLLHSE